MRLLAVIEPPGATPTDAFAPVLVAEARRIATGMGHELHVISWRAGEQSGGQAPLEQVAVGLAEVADRVRPAAVLLADTAVGRRLAPLIAHHLGCAAVLGCSDVLAVTGEAGPLFVKPVYGGWLEKDCRAAPEMPVVATLDLTGLEAPEGAGATPTATEVVEVAHSGPARVRRLDLLPPDPRSVDLVHAKRIVAAGAGSAGGTLLSAARELADLLEGSLGATRPVVDDGKLPKERLIGQTGKTVSPDLYLALGISGSPHHMAGVQKAGRIISVNRDIRAPIFGFSDTGYVADLEAVLPLLLEKIKAWRDRAEDTDGPV